MSKIYKFKNKLEIDVGRFQVEYAGCGTHSQTITFETDLDDINKLLAQLGLKPLKSNEAFPPKDNQQ